MAVFFVDPYVKYYNNLSSINSIKNSVVTVNNNIVSLNNEVNKVISSIDSSKWKELGQESISTNVLPTLSSKLTNISSDISSVLYKAVNDSSTVHDKCTLLKEKDLLYEEAENEYNRLKSNEPSYYNGDSTIESSEHYNWKEKVEKKKEEKDKLESECKTLTSEIDTLVTSINKLEISSDSVEISSVSSGASTLTLGNDTYTPLIDITGVGDGNGNTISTTSDVTKVSADTSAKYSVDVPSNIKQSGYTVTGYDKWIKTGKTMVWAKGTNQRAVSEVWKSQGSKFKNGIATVNVNGEDRYLIATSSTFGKVGDSVNVRLGNGQTVKCVIADQKSSNDKNYTKYGHGQGNGSVNVLEFEVERSKYQSSGNPSTSKWNLEWDSTSPVTRVDNYGSVL